MVRKINGKNRGIGNLDRYEVLPGHVSFEVAYISWGVMSTSRLIVSFEAKAGGEYLLDYWRVELSWGVFVVDKTSGSRIAAGVPAT